jgi:hypothetical protein
MPTWQPSPTPAYYPTLAPQAAPPQAAPQYVEQPAPVEVVDGYLSAISGESLEILNHFGPEAPYKLNTYSTQVEDALLESLDHQVRQAQAIQAYEQQAQQMLALIEVAHAERQALTTILTDPEELSNYTRGFFSEGGPYPVQTPGEEARARLAEGMVQPTGPLMPQQDARAYEYEMLARGMDPRQMQQAPQGWNAMPAPNVNQASAADVWGAFSQAMDNRPEDAWRVLAAATPDQIRAKIMFMEG